jgi:hypothetical protein
MTFGEPDVKRLQQRLTARQFRRWLRYYQQNPWGEWRADLRAGIIATAVLSPWCGKGKRPKPTDFMPTFRRTQQTAQHMWNILMAGTKALKATKHGKGITNR